MITFKQYILLTENILTNVRANILGLNASFELPPRPPYGFWTDRSGNYKSIPNFASGGHAQAAREIIMAAFEYKDKTGQLTPQAERNFTKSISAGMHALYRILFELNFMHVVIKDTTYIYYIEGGGSPTPSQQKFLTNLKQTYSSIIERSRAVY